MSLFRNRSYFYHSHIRRMISVFGYTFSNISVARFNSEGKIEKMISPVPIRFANEDVDLALLRDKVNTKDDKRLSSGFKEEFPRLTYTLDNIQYNPDRKTSRNSRIRWIDDAGNRRETESPVPYVASFTLNMIARNHIDAMQIFEQIGAAFQPSITVKIKDYPVDGCIYDMPVSLVSTSIEDNFDSGVDEKRRVIYSMEFEVMFHMFGPTRNGIEYEALVYNLKQQSGCEEIDNNDIDRLRGRNSNIDKLIEELERFDDSNSGQINEIVLKYQAVSNDIIGSDGSSVDFGLFCNIVDLSQVDLESIESNELIETEQKIVK